jgi:hypothetical protein
MNNHIPREGDTLIKVRYSLERKLSGKYRDFAINAFDEYLSLGRYESMNKERINNWLNSRYGEEYGEVYHQAYPSTELGLLRLVEITLDQYPSDWDKNYEDNYRKSMIFQMGMDAKTGESICLRDLPLKDVFLHHIFYWKGTSDFDHIVAVSRSTHPTIAHPGKSGLNIESVKDMMILDRAKRNFLEFKPPEHWSNVAKQEYNARLELYRIFGFQIFLNIKGYITS